MTWLRIVAVLVGLGVWGWSMTLAYQRGVAVSDARHAAAREALQEDLFGVADKARQAAADLARRLRAGDESLAEFEDETRTDPGRDGRVPDADSLRDLEDLWSRARGGP